MAKILANQHTQDWINLVLAIVLFISPWALGFMGERNPSWNAWISGVLIGAVALGALSVFREWEEWLNLLLGLWVVASPWILGFAAVSYAMGAHVALGLLIAASAAWEIWEVRHEPHVTV
jgi:heme/copper-type cytochrome/quinol oxidase subunit 3